MGWADVDFNFIIPGANVFAQEVSFGAYFNAFGVALDERQALIGDVLNLIVPSGIRFEAGEITNDVFWDKLRDMIEGYNDLWFNAQNEFYEVGVLTDVLNSGDYLISDTDLETAMGADAYDILVNYGAMSNQEIFKAALFTGLYELLQLTFYVKKPVVKTNSGLIYENLPVYLTDATVNQWVGISGLQDTYSQALSAYNADLTYLTPARGSNIFMHWLHGPDQEGFSGAGSWRVELSTSQDFMAFSILSKDLADVVLNIDYIIGSVVVANNYNRDTSVDPTSEIAYTDKYPISIGGNIPAPTYIGSTAQNGTRGSIQEAYINGSEGTDPPLMGPMANKPDDPGSTITSRARVLIYIPQIAFVDLNNSALEYYITP